MNPNRNPEPQDERGNAAEASFTLLETIIAVSLMVVLLLQVSGVQGNSVRFRLYADQATRAAWLAQRVMAQVEHYWHTKPFSEMETKVTEERFDEYPEYSYSLRIEEWELPIMSILTGGLAGGSEDADDDQGEAGGDPLAGAVSQVLGDELLKTAYVEVFWGEGARRDSVTLTTLLTNQKKLDELIAGLKPVYDQLTRPKKKKKKTQGKRNPRDRGDGDGGR